MTDWPTFTAMLVPYAPLYQAVESHFRVPEPIELAAAHRYDSECDPHVTPKWPMVFQIQPKLAARDYVQLMVTFAYVGSRGNHLGPTAEGNPFPAGREPRPCSRETESQFWSIVRYLTPDCAVLLRFSTSGSSA